MAAYVCNRWPYLKIGKAIRFHEGLFETQDPEVQATLEAHPDYGLHIHPKSLREPVVAPSVSDDSDAEPRVRAGRRGSR